MGGAFNSDFGLGMASVSLGMAGHSGGSIRVIRRDYDS